MAVNARAEPGFVSDSNFQVIFVELTGAHCELCAQLNGRTPQVSASKRASLAKQECNQAGGRSASPGFRRRERLSSQATTERGPVKSETSVP